MDATKAIAGLEQFKKDFKPFVGNPADWEQVDDALAALKGIADIRCKNCLHFLPSSSGKLPKEAGVCNLLEKIFDGEIDYCSYFVGGEQSCRILKP